MSARSDSLTSASSWVSRRSRRVHDRHAAPERGEDAGVLATDHAAADDHHALRNPLQHQDVVTVHYDLAVERNLGGAERVRAGGDEDHVRREAVDVVKRVNLDGVRVRDFRRALDHADSMLGEVLGDELPGRLDHGALAIHEVRDRDVVLDVVLDAVESALLQAREVEGRLTQRLGRNRARVDGCAAGLRGAFDDAYALAEIRRLRGALFAGWTAPTTSRSK